ncbi:FecR family protein [Flavicella sediminum]|uniref:FecR family protein n=1 Tax=Flavicella sediminum TaxID=2585141 RepID=UPI001123CF05|nr:FecR domain-containing protein [Flavicella sediminum]
MKNEKEILKWLNGDMSPEELADFSKTEDFSNYAQIASESEKLNYPSVDPNVALKDFKARVAGRKKKETKVISLKNSIFYKVAASVVILLGISYFFYSMQKETLTTTFGENKTVLLADDSRVVLNAVSSIAFKKRNFESSRELTLQGEAFFEVTKKGKFEVQTSLGVVNVLGTKFNVKSRENYFEVFCYEGKVSVAINKQTVILTPGKGVVLQPDGRLKEVEDASQVDPKWLHAESVFTEVPFSEVLAEFERQYKLTISAKNIDVSVLYSGGFSHKNKEAAIQSISLPLGLNYRIENDKIELYK